MPIRINATRTRTTSGSTNTTKPRSFNRNFSRSRRPASTFEQRNSLAAYISHAQAAPKQPKKSADGWTTMASKKHIRRIPLDYWREIYSTLQFKSPPAGYGLEKMWRYLLE